MKKILITLITFSLFTTFHTQIVVNEYSASNLFTYSDNYGDYVDWFEIYNPSGSVVDLTGWYLSDNVNNPIKCQLSGGSVPAGGRTTIFCSGRDEVSGGNIHTSFKLTQTKPEEIIITDAAGNIVDQVQMIPCKPGHSRGRDADGSATWALFTSPTPNAANANPKPEYATTPIFDIVPGYQTGNISLNISSPDPNVTLYYTNNGTTPTISSTTVSGPISINTNTVIRAIAISSDPNVPHSFIETNTYFINSTHTIPIVSICGDDIFSFINDQHPNAFYDNFLGAIEYFSSAGTLIDEGVGDYNKHGNDSWSYDQRGIDFIMRDQQGYNYAIQHQIFRGKNRDDYQRLIIKAAANDNVSFENGGAHIRDAYVHSLSQVGGLRLDERSYEPCILYVNGEYWGVYELREKVGDSDFLDEYYDQDEKYNNSPEFIQFLKTWGGTWEQFGAPYAQSDWNSLRNYIQNNNMTVQANFDYVDSLYNWKSLVDYFCLNSYTVCMDWLNWNTAWWRGLEPSGDKKKWRYVLWDMDATFGHYINYTGIPDQSANADPCNPELLPDPGGQGHTEILIKLLDNPTFYQFYVSRFIDLGNTVYSCDYMINHLDSLIAIIEPEMPGQVAKWGSSMNTWNNNVQSLRTFITDRCLAIQQGMVDCYNLDGPYEITYDVNPAGAGDIKVNSIWLNNYPFTGDYYGGIDILLKANANTGYIFDYWESSITDPFTSPLDSSDNSFQITGPQNLIAHFRLDGDPPTPTYDGVNIPSAFSPNGDGNNDLLDIFAGVDVLSFSMDIYNRWGQLLFNTKSTSQLWDGSLNGTPVNSGVYIYKVNVIYNDGNSEVKHGNITLIR
jgi:gliding motility-associated-like protein